MKKWKKIPIVMSAIILAAYLLAGCGNGKSDSSADISMVSIKKDGTIEHMIIDRFDEAHREWYDIDELTVKGQEKIDSINDGTDNIVIESVEEKDGKIIVKMTYKTGEDYTRCNNRELFYGTVEEASAMGFSIKSIFSEDGTELNDIKQIWENHVVIIQTKKGEELDVNVYDKILYTSDNVVRSGNNDVIIKAGDTDIISCIVFK
ncbi:MAG: hypothetical protein HDR12_09020 [Lachnospiraceae bacterium]|nr:hypothetical protein [Lachnospiraceae bacterium]